MAFPWYELCGLEDNLLQQGDFVPECPIVIPPVHLAEGDDVEIDVQKIDAIVLSQSCDWFYQTRPSNKPCLLYIKGNSSALTDTSQPSKHLFQS